MGAYRDAVLADGATAYWRLEEASGLSLADETGHGYDAVLPAATGLTYHAPGALADGSFGIGLAGTQGPAAFTPLAFAPPCSVEVLLRLAVQSDSYGAIVEHSGGVTGLYIRQELGQMFADLYDLEGDHLNTTLLVPGARVHLILTIDAAFHAIWYVDGQPDGSFTHTPWVVGGPYPWSVLFNDELNEGLEATLVDELSIYVGTCLSSEQVAQHYALAIRTIAGTIVPDTASPGDAEDVKRTLKRMIEGPEFIAKLASVVTTKGDGTWPTLPVTVYAEERLTHDRFPMAELIVYRSSFDDEEWVKKTVHQIGVRWTAVGPDEVTVTRQVERLVRATTDLLWMSNLDMLVQSGPIRVTDEDYSPLLPTATHPFVKSGLVLLHVPVWRD